MSRCHPYCYQRRVPWNQSGTFYDMSAQRLGFRGRSVLRDRAVNLATHQIVSVCCPKLRMYARFAYRIPIRRCEIQLVINDRVDPLAIAEKHKAIDADACLSVSISVFQFSMGRKTYAYRTQHTSSSIHSQHLPEHSNWLPASSFQRCLA